MSVHFPSGHPLWGVSPPAFHRIKVYPPFEPINCKFFDGLVIETANAFRAWLILLQLGKSQSCSAQANAINISNERSPGLLANLNERKLDARRTAVGRQNLRDAWFHERSTSDRCHKILEAISMMIMEEPSP
jgi:hypothetical protein